MSVKTRSRLIVFVFAFLVWVAITNIKDMQEVIAGIIVAAVVSALSGQFLITTEKSGSLTKRILYFLFYIVTFLWEMVKANLNVAAIVIHPKLPIKPGIVKIKTSLNKDSALTVLTNSITLTPGTLTVDADVDKGELFIHWISVKTEDVDEATKQISSVFEKILKEVFE